MIPIIICKIFEDKKNSSFEERYYCLKLFLSWLKLSDANFPIIIPQSIASMTKTDDNFKIGCIEFIREMSISRPDLCSTVGGFRILVNSALEGDTPKNIIDKIIYAFRYVINTPSKRKYFNGYGELYKIFAIFTKSDFSSGIINNTETLNQKKKDEIKEESNKLERQLNSAIYIIKQTSITWPGYFVIINDSLKLASLTQSINNDVNIVIKKAILKLFKEILEYFYNIADNFTKVCSDDLDIFYINKYFGAYMIQALYESHLNENLFEFIENESDELKDYAIKLIIKFNIMLIKLTNDDLHSAYAKEKIETIKWYNTLNYENSKYEQGRNVKNSSVLRFYLPDYDNQKTSIRIKIMFIMDKIFHHFNCKDIPMLNIGTLSTEVIIAINGLLSNYIKNMKINIQLKTVKKNYIQMKNVLKY